MLGFQEVDWAAAECLDVWGIDVEETLMQAEDALCAKIRKWK